MSEAQRVDLIGRLERGCSFDREFRIPALGRGGHYVRWGAAYCCECARADEAEHGFTYWHVAWQHPGVMACPTHGVPLTCGCQRCQFSQLNYRQVRFPSSRCFCGEEPIPLIAIDSPDLQTHIRIAHLFDCILGSSRFFADECDLGSLLAQRAIDLGYRRGCMQLDRRRLAGDFIEQYGESSLMKLGCTRTAQFHLFRRLASRMRPASILHALYLIDFLCGSFDAFCHEVGTFKRTARTQTESQSTMKTSRISRETEDESVQRLRAYMKAHPDATRTEILSKCASSARRLRQNRKLYEEVLPSSRRKTGYAEGRIHRMVCLDETLLSHARSRYALLRGSALSDSGGLSIRALLRGHPGMPVFYKCREMLPKTNRFLMEVTNKEVQKR
ncbi:TniQ family protein [Paraburkholderia caribensis]|uniref:TniQ family protein n=1 Tax=Paraburkholderia caribensis TaxID=75105 RepID=UPI003CD07643